MFDSREGIAVYRGWHALEQSLPGKISILDFDLVPEIADTERFHSRQQVLERIRNLRDSVDVVDETTEFIRAKLNASCYYLRCLEGEQFEFYEHVRNMLGKTPELIAAEQVSQQETTVFQLLEKQFGVPLTDGRPTEADFQTFDDSIRLSKLEALQEAREAEAKLVPIVLDILGFSDLDVAHDTEPCDQDEYWMAWSSGEKGAFLLRYNFHSKHRWRKGDMEYLTLHEVCGHFVHAASLAREIQEGRLDPFIGITTEHDPHGFMGEGIADALTYSFPGEIPLSTYAILSREQRNWRDYLNNNAHILINMGEDKEKLLEYLLRNPFTSTERAEVNLDRWRGHPLWRSYQYSYGIALKYHRAFASRTSRQQRVEYLRWAFRRYVTPRRLIEYANSLTGN